MEDVLLTEKTEGNSYVQHVDSISQDVEDKLKELLEKMPRKN